MGIATLTAPRLRPSAAGPGAGSRVVVSTRAVVSTPQTSSSFRRAKPPGARLASRARWGVGAGALIRPGATGGPPYRALRSRALRVRAHGDHGARPARSTPRPVRLIPQTPIPGTLRACAKFPPPSRPASPRPPPTPPTPRDPPRSPLPISSPISEPDPTPLAASPPVLTRPRPSPRRLPRSPRRPLPLRERTTQLHGRRRFPLRARPRPPRRTPRLPPRRRQFRRGGVRLRGWHRHGQRRRPGDRRRVSRGSRT